MALIHTVLAWTGIGVVDLVAVVLLVILIYAAIVIRNI